MYHLRECPIMDQRENNEIGETVLAISKNSGIKTEIQCFNIGNEREMKNQNERKPFIATIFDKYNCLISLCKDIKV